jgi:hypothetical protein
LPNDGQGLLRYINVSAQEKARTAWAVIVVDENNAAMPILRATAEQTLSEAGYRSRPIFRSALIDDGKFDVLYRADADLLNSLAPYCAGLILGRVRGTVTERPELNGLYSYRLEGTMKILSTSNSGERELRIVESGAGFSTAGARDQAERRAALLLKPALIREIANITAESTGR